ncbi:MAG: NADH-quinone oxidoreductase subunit A [Planctomycetes bacterium]|nr:NADH-quinone oxidoreductase subunit A [Planctomycetota bacterium]
MTTMVSILAILGPTAAANPAAHGGTNIELVVGMVLFILAGVGIALGGLLVGKIARPTMPHPEKETAYECGEPAVGDSWVQFDLRFYAVALVFIVFDVEVALLWPWAVAFKEMGAPAFWAFLVFFVLIAVPFLYEWKSGYLDWVRASTGQRRSSGLEKAAPGSTA